MKYMRKLIAITILFVLISANGIGVYAAENSQTYMDNDLLFDCNEYEEMMDAVLNAEILYTDGVISNEPSTINENGIISNQFGNSYKIYSLVDPDFVTALQNGKNLSEIISNQYIWILPTKDNSTIKVIEESGEWRVIGYSRPRTTGVVTDLVDMNTVDDAVSDLQVEHGTYDISVQCFSAGMYYTNFAYLSINNHDYLIPFGKRPDITGLDNGKVYTPQEVCEILETLTTISAENNGGVGGTLHHTFGLYTGPVVAISIVAVGFIVSILIVVKNKKLRKW